MLKYFKNPTALLSVLLCMLVFSNRVSASTDPTITTRLRGQVDSIQVNSEITTRDQNFYAMASSIERTFLVQNVVSVSIDESSPYFIQTDFDVTITLQITSTRADGTDTVFNKDFRINYLKADSSKNAVVNYYSFKNGYTVKVKILSITPASTINWDYKKVLIIKNDITATRDYVFTCTKPMPLPHITMPTVLNPDELYVSWDDPANGQTEYDLEWAWIDESAVALYKTGANFDQDKIFTNNATRATVNLNSYLVPLLYDDDGRLFIRVRPVQTKENGQRVEGVWSTTAANAANDMYVFGGHEPALNWQASTSFSEGGKRKTLVQYFDGTLRARQTVTKDNSMATLTSSGTTIVAETFYDYQGRAVIQVLPAPTLNTIISYSHNFNQSADLNGYPKSYYDKLDPNGSICGDPAAALSNTSGTSQYYSSMNPLQANGFNKYIPDAQGYPFTETRFKPDGTVASLGGVGNTYRIGSNHEIKYTDEVPAQSELDALFGTDAGINTHYTKNWVKDANGQYSISYVDMHGRTVATSLAGQSPASQKPLESLNTKTITKNLLDPTTNIITGRSVISHSSLVLDKDGDVLFKYALVPEQLKLLDCNHNQICYDCLYDLIITVTPECNSVVIPGSPHIKSNFTLGDYANNNNCAANSPFFNEIFTLPLKEGTYTITKELRLSSDAQAYHRDSIFMHANTCKTLQTFNTDQYNLLTAQTNCNITCQACNLSIGANFSEFVNKILVKTGLTVADTAGMTSQFQIAYDEAKAGCERICNKDHDDGLGNIQNMRKIMLLDMTPPGGQYARIDAASIALPYNIFSTAAAPAGTYFLNYSQTPYYLNPLNLTTGSDPLAASSYQQNHLYNDMFGVAQLDVNAPVSQTSLPPLDFSNQFQPNWAEALLPYHPEYHKLVVIETQLVATNNYEGGINDIDTWADAASHGYINNILGQDPFFSGPGAGKLSQMQQKMSNLFSSNICPNGNLSMWQVAEASVFCRNKTDNHQCTGNEQFDCAINQYVTPPNNPPTNCVDWDYAWKAFKTSYLGERKKLIDEYVNEQCPEIHNDQIESYNTSTNTVYTIHFPVLGNAINVTGLGDIMDQINNGDYNGAQATAQAQAPIQADSTCKGYATMWYNRLMTCPEISSVMNPVDSAWIIDNLRNICKAGSDEYHPLGSSSIYSGDQPVHDNSTTVPWSGGDYREFPDVISRYLQEKGIAISSLCHPYLIEAPKPYDKQPALANMPVVTKPLECQCDLLRDLRNEYQAAGTAGTFSQFLEYQHGTYISQGALDTLQSLCDGSYQPCIFIKNPIKLPPILQCNGHNEAPPKTCINCRDFTEIKNNYNALFHPPVEAPIENPASPEEVAINHSFELYANYQTGFQKHWSEWVAFQHVCVGTGPIPCDSLEYVLQLFYLSPQYIQNPSGSQCRLLFAQFFNNYFHTFYSFDQIMDLFLSSCGYVPDVCKPKLTCEQFKALINQFYDDNGVTIFKNPNCSSIFTTYFNLKQHTNYTYNEIEALYEACGCRLDVCVFPNCFLLTKAFNVFKAQYGITLWNNEDCKKIFTIFFNNYFQFNDRPYEWETIAGFYQKCFELGCGPDLSTLCQPPYSCETLRNIIDLFYEHFGVDITQTVHCKDSFALFFNQHMGTNYTYAQIAALYAAICHSQLQVCSPIYDCRELILLITNFKREVIYTPENCQQKFVDYFNTYYGTSYTFEEIMDIYKKYCGDVPKICDGAIVISDCKQIERFLEVFMSNHPDPSGEFGAECQAVFTELFNSEFGTDYNYETIANYYLVLCNKTLDICKSSCDIYAQLITKMPTGLCTSLKLPSIAGKQLFVYFFNQQLKQIGREEMKLDEIMKIIRDCPITIGCTVLTNETPVFNINDPDVLLSLKLSYYLLHPDGLPDDCESDFASWVNLCMNIKFDYGRLHDIYETVLGPGAGDICEIKGGLKRKVIMLKEAGAVPVTSVPATMPGTNPATGPSSSMAPLFCGLNEPVYPDGPPLPDPCSDLINVALGFAEDQFELYKDSLRNVFDTAYMNKCLSAKSLETFTATYSSSEYHYTLYYFDQAGNLVKTVPPAGVHPNYSASWLNTDVPAARASGAKLTPPHTLVTNYRYNTFNQVIAQSTPDGGVSKYWYDRLGRLVITQNAKQAEVIGNVTKYSYRIYDDFARMIEIGEKPKSAFAPLMTQTISQDEFGPNGLRAWLNTSTITERKQQITRTVYDEAWPPFCGSPDPANNILCAKNLRNRVSYSYVKATDDPDPNYLWDAATFYSYDIHGNVDTLLQDYKGGMGAINCSGNPSGNRWKKMVYKYDLISGKVNELAYQPGQVDQFFHRYEYDAENRLTHVQTSKDKLYWENDATYNYYKHGPMARVVLGQEQVQGIDYAYTLQGWLKGVNSTNINAGEFDMGNDGKSGTPNSLVARDAYGYSLNYYNGDYIQINTTVSAFASISNTLPVLGDNVNTGQDLFNGNISSMLVNVPKLGDAQLYGYRYDQLNRIVAMNSFSGMSNTGNTSISPSIASDDYKERISYDANGNILSYVRNGAATASGLSMDNLSYKYDYYTAGGVRKTYTADQPVPADADRLTNQLNYVIDAAGGTYTEDIKNENLNNYTYDKVGNLISDVADGITNIDWNVYGKIINITKHNSVNNTDIFIHYTYDATGNRISKTVTVNNVAKTTYYVRDASDNVMSVYVAAEATINGGDLTQTEIHLYGSGRLGIYNVNNDVQCLSAATDITTFIRGNKFFELTNHLQNVLVTITDKKIAVDANNDGQIDYYNADIITANDYYLFGMMMPGRKYTAGAIYRYGFNGKEIDKDIEEGAIVFEARIYDNRLGRFLSVDPWFDKYPAQSPYVFAHDNPILLIDYLGLGDPPTEHKVVKNENTWNIAKQALKNAGNKNPTNKQILEYQTKLKNLNKLSSDGVIHPGQVLKLPPLQTATPAPPVVTGKAPTENSTKEEVAESYAEALEKIKFWLEAGKIPIEGVTNLSNLKAYQEAFKEGKFIATYNQQQKLWKFAFQGNQYVSSADVLAAKAATINKAGAFEVLETVGKTANFLVLGISVYNVGNDLYHGRGVTLEHGADLVMAGVAFIPVYGWIVSGAYFIGKEIPWQSVFKAHAQWEEDFKKVNGHYFWQEVKMGQ